MDKPLFALQSDLDMIAIQVQTLSLSLNKLDWIIQRIKRLDEELTCQGEQMRRMETQISHVENNMDKIMTHLKIK